MGTDAPHEHLEDTLHGGSAMTPLPPGTPARLLHYEVLGLLGRGGMGAVFKARDTRLDRLVALKRVLPGEPGAEALSERLLLEARAAAALTHPNLVTVYAIEALPDGLCLVMELLEGETLEARLARGPLSVEEALGVGRELCEALACVHDAGLVHRDVKPANVMLTARGVRLLDLGIAKRTRTDGAAALVATAAGAVVGTWPYMAPEQVRGDAVDARTDLFALGTLLYEATTGRLPFDGQNIATLASQILTHAPTAPRALRAQLPAALDLTILRALQKAPSERFASAREMAAALRPARPHALASPPPGGEDGVVSVAVLPWRDLSPNADQGHLCEGLPEELMVVLGRVPGVRVASRQLAFRFGGADVDVGNAGRSLGVDRVFEGAVRRSGDRLRVTVQLVDVASGRQLWSQRFDGSTADVFAIEDAIAGGVVEALQGRLSPATRDQLRRQETSPEAYESYLRGRQLAWLDTVTASEGAAQAFQRCLALDPDFAPAHAALAMLCANQADYFAGGEASRGLAEAASARAVSLAPTLVEARVARALVLTMRGEYEAADAEYREALRLNPRHFDANYYHGRNLILLGRPAEAVDRFLVGAQVQADDFQCLCQASSFLAQVGRGDEVRGVLEEGLARIERLLRIDPHHARAMVFGANMLAQLGRRDEAIAWCARVLGEWPDDAMVLINVACIFSILKDTGRALDCLERCADRGFGKRAWFEKDPDYAALHGEPRWHALLARLG